MTSNEWHRIASVYEASLDRSASDRDAFLRDACAGDESLKREVESLLAEADEPSPLDQPVWVPTDLCQQTCLSPGTMVGPYEIEGVLGAGGMGTVYRARDTKLGRVVALKLPAQLAAHPERLARFRREAQILAALNHPNIGAIYGLEETRETPALVLELVEGETIAARIARGRLAADESLAIIRQIADALDAAHEQGIVHCDLKPLNIKITPTGQVKVLDFGLARLAQAAAVDAGEIAPGPSAGRNIISTELLVGTPAYLSPEQAQGKPADRRSDIWAFGCVAWEILTGRRLFNGDSVAEILASIVRDEPDLTQLAPDTQPSIRRLLRRCLAKNPRERLQHIGDARLELTEAGDDVALGEKRPQHRVRERVAWGLALATALFALLTVYRGSRSPDPEPESHVEIVGPSTNDPSSIAISPDGRTIAYTAEIQPGRSVLWIRRLDSLDSPVARPLPSTDGASNPFWSPDSSAIAYCADQMLKRIDVESGVIQSLARASGANRGGSWSPNNVIIFVPTAAQPVRRIPAGGGEAVEVTPSGLVTASVDVAPEKLPPAYPAFLPDGQHFLFYVAERNGPGGVYAGDVSGSPPKRVFDADSAAVSASGMVLFVRSGALLAQRFDQSRMSLLGTPRRIAEKVFRNQSAKAALSVSGSSAILYRRDFPEERRRLAWFDRAGKQVAVVSEPLSGGDLLFLSPALSRDERRLAISLAVEDREGHLGTRHIWLLDLRRGIRTRVTADPAVDDSGPVWAPDGRSLIFARGSTKLVQLSISANHEQVIGREPGIPSDWSPDGKFLLFRQANQRTGYDIFGLALGAAQPFPVVQTEYDEKDAQFAPDGRWIAFQSSESGRFEIYIQPFPNSESRKVLVSAGGGAQVRWRRDGRELFYIALDGSLMAVPIRFAPDGHSFESDTPVRLFTTNVGGAVQGVARQQYVVSADGRRFLMNTVVDNGVPSPLELILHWRGL